mgnify:CR=1 FL=1
MGPDTLMPLVQWGEWKPDISDFEGNTTKNIQKVYPRGDGYGPTKAFVAATQAMFAACRGAFYALKSDGSVQLFAGTSNQLYSLNNTDFSWKPVGRVATVTISSATPGVVTYNSHGFAVNEPVVF